jgi:hypothetical protein
VSLFTKAYISRRNRMPVHARSRESRMTIGFRRCAARGNTSTNRRQSRGKAGQFRINSMQEAAFWEESGRERGRRAGRGGAVRS